MINFIKRFFAYIVGLMCVLFFMIFSNLWYFANDLPDYKVLSEYKPPVSSRVYSGDGDLIAEYAIQKRLFISFDSIHLNQAVYLQISRGSDENRKHTYDELKPTVYIQSSAIKPRKKRK